MTKRYDKKGTSNYAHPSVINAPSRPEYTSHDQRYYKERCDEWAVQVAGFEPGTPHHLIFAYKTAFDALTDAGRALAQYHDELEAKAQQ